MLELLERLGNRLPDPARFFLGGTLVGIAERTGLMGAVLKRMMLAAHVGLALLSGPFVAPASAQPPLCDAQWLAGASDARLRPA